VLCTHLHIDHVGWNTKLVNGAWVPTFEHARYLMVEPEFRYWRDQREDAAHATSFAESVKPVFDAGLVDLVSGDFKVCDEVRFEPTVGHTPAHASIRIRSKGADALITGDFLHHPCQLARPDWAAAVDYDKVRSTQTRHEVFSALAGTPTLMIGTHFAGPSAGRVVRDGDGYRLVV
jgi:glyoxylase-like metal-dependent hydrolase (beta-lactamase superfamily II)